MSFVIPQADVTEAISAMDELRAGMGTAINFGVPQDPTWPVGTAINPDTNLPFDSTVVPVSGEFAFTEVICLIIAKQGSPLRPQADTSFEMSGMRLGADIILDIATADYQSVGKFATVFTADGIDYAVEEAKPYSMGNTIYRWLIYGAAK